MAARKKDPSARARANSASTRATLSEGNVLPAARRPKLPTMHDERGRIVAWHPQTKAWWADVWASPMAGQWHPSDRHSLFLIALLVERMWKMPASTSAQQMSVLAAEIRQQRQAFGLTPYDRRRLEWQIEVTGEAQDRGARRRSGAVAPAPPKAGSAAARKAAAADPRHVLHAV